MTDNANQNFDDISLDDIFQSDEDISEEEVEEVEEETPAEESEEKSEEAEPEEAEKQEDDSAILEKRLKDTQRYAHKLKNTSDRRLNKLLEDGKISQEEFDKYSTDEEPLQGDITAELTGIEKTTREQLTVLADALPDRDVNKEYEDFIKLTRLDPSLLQELIETPDNKRLSYMLSHGAKATSVLDMLDQHDGSVIDALQSKVGDDKVAEAETRGYEKAKKEFQEQMKELSSDKRPKLRGESVGTEKEDHSGEVDLDFL